MIRDDDIHIVKIQMPEEARLRALGIVTSPPLMAPAAYLICAETALISTFPLVLTVGTETSISVRGGARTFHRSPYYKYHGTFVILVHG